VFFSILDFVLIFKAGAIGSIARLIYLQDSHRRRTDNLFLHR